MYYTDKQIRLHYKALNYLKLIQDTNSRYEDKRTSIAIYDSDKFRLINPIKPLNYDFNQSYMGRMKKLSEWLVYRYNNKLMELNQENDKQLSKLLNNKNIPA